MPTAFKVRVPISTKDSFIEVKNNLTPGVHTFTLVVVDDQGNRSAPAIARILVKKNVPNPNR